VSVDPAYKVVRGGALAKEAKWKDRIVIDGLLGIDVSKDTLDASMSSATRCAQRALRILLMDGAISWIG